MNKESPLVCICVPTYNVEGTVKESIETILSQSYKNLVVHVSDNCSTDATLSVIESIGDSRITLHRHEINVGGEGNFTRCIELAEGKYTAIFHADDLYEPEMVAKQVTFLESNPNICAVFTTATLIDENGRALPDVWSPPFDARQKVAIYDFNKLLKTTLLHHNFLICPSAMVRTETYKKVIKVWGCDLFKSASDVDTWLRLAQSAPIAVLNDPLMRYRISSAQYSDINRKRTTRADFFLVMDEYLSRPEAKNILTDEDYQRYGWLLRHENVACAINLLAIGDVEKAKTLLNGIFCRDSLFAALATRRGFLTLTTGLLLRFLIFIGASSKSATIINKIKRIA